MQTRFDGFNGLSGFDGLGEFDGLSGFDGLGGFSGFGRFDGFSGFDRSPIFKWFLSFINFATKGFFYLLVDYPLSYTWLNGEPQISRKERYKDIFPGTYILEYLMIDGIHIYIIYVHTIIIYT